MLVSIAALNVLLLLASFVVRFGFTCKTYIQISYNTSIVKCPHLVDGYERPRRDCVEYG
jgi:hypothetical protein